jgi:hypothetical protein
MQGMTDRTCHSHTHNRDLPHPSWNACQNSSPPALLLSLIQALTSSILYICPTHIVVLTHLSVLISNLTNELSVKEVVYSSIIYK